MAAAVFTSSAGAVRALSSFRLGTLQRKFREASFLWRAKVTCPTGCACTRRCFVGRVSKPAFNLLCRLRRDWLNCLKRTEKKKEEETSEFRTNDTAGTFPVLDKRTRFATRADGVTFTLPAITFVLFSKIRFCARCVNFSRVFQIRSSFYL